MPMPKKRAFSATTAISSPSMAFPICARKFCRGRVVNAQAMANPPSTEVMQKMVIRQKRDTVMPIMRGT